MFHDDTVSVCRCLGTGVRRALPLALLLGSVTFAGTPARAQKTVARVPIVHTRAANDDIDYVDDDEVKLGRQNAEENDRQVKLVTDSAILERVNRIGKELADVANRQPVTALWGSTQVKAFHYTFKVVDDKDVNAYSLPGGFIYVNKGLIDYVHSDDELAGVLAHEISHAAHHHVMKLLREQRKLNNVLLPLQIAALAAMIAGGGRGGGSNNVNAGQGILMASNLYQTAKINTYSIDAERDADHSGLLLMTHTHFNPVGLYSFMLRLEKYEMAHGGLIDQGIYRTHPPSPERIASAKSLLQELNIPLSLSEVDPDMQAAVTTTRNGTLDVAEISIRGQVLCRVIAADGMTADQRAHRLGQRLATLFDTQVQPFEVRVSRDQSRVTVRGVAILTDQDALAQNKTLEVMARDMANAITLINQKQQIETGM